MTAWTRALGERADHLPRETRDTLFQLFVIGWTIAPHLLHLPVWCGLMSMAVLVWRGRLALRAGALPSRWTLSVFLLAAGFGTWWSERTLLGREAGITMLVVLVALKTLELRARRDALVIFFLGFFLVLTHFLYSQSLGTGLWLLGAVWGLLTALALAHMPVGRPPLRRPAGVALRAALLGVPVMVAAFVLFPRIGPLWGLPQDAQGRTGLSGSLRLGGVASIAEDDSIAMRVRFFGPAPRPNQLYFRGPVLSEFDGREWTRLVPRFPAAQRPRIDAELIGTPLRYELTVEPSRLSLLPMLELTPDREGAAPRVEGMLLTLRADAQWQADRALSDRVRVTASAWLEHRHGPRRTVLGLRDYVRLPPASNPRTLEWAAELRRRLPDADARTLADAVLDYIRTGGFTYTLEPGTYELDPIDEFWLERKLGFCEHFAAAFVVVMRALDVPSRIVTGYQGADPEPQDGYWIVRQRDAHAWAEIWVEGQGWQRVDPTAAVAPERVQRSRRLAPPPGLVAAAVDSVAPALMVELRRSWEMLNNRWNQWVLNYGRGEQNELMRGLGFQSPSWRDLAAVLIALLSATALAGAGWAWWDRHRQDPWQRLQQRVLLALRARGVEVQAHHPPRERAARLRAALGEAGEAAARELDALDRLRYGGGAARWSGHSHWWRGFAAALARSDSG